MRGYVVWLAVMFLSAYAIRDWFKPACVLILMMAVYGHPDMPTNAMGIQGLNPWNLLCLFCLIGFLVKKRAEGIKWDLGAGMTLLFAIYAIVVVVGVVRLYGNQSVLMQQVAMGAMDRVAASKGSLISEYFVNTLKWLIPGFLVFMGARTEERKRVVLAVILITYFIVALIAVRRLPLLAVISGENVSMAALKVLQQAFGWSRVNTATLLAGGSWALLLGAGWITQGRYRWAIFGGFCVSSLALAMTGGRMGMVAWLVLAVVFALTKWRKGLLLIPLALVALPVFAPGIVERAFEGVSQEDDWGRTAVEIDQDDASSGRFLIWPIVVDKILDRPVTGYGRLGMRVSGANIDAQELLGIPIGERGFPHPHNAYLQVLLDNGLVAGSLILLLYFLIFARVMRLGFSSTANPGDKAIGLVAFSLVASFLVCGFGSQTFYPVQGSLAMWAAIGLALRCSTDQDDRSSSQFG